ncbi:DNA mismatch repair protein MSH2 [Trypanosoma theileri]|uniref:DNA mismatch repair protein MSH2 n=1 Tax=Trypanosoma theileri TaxID=67003 RepID=A0A1X0NW35_9TRYP|nr:DNA mismatch repair protein MSH2 [Trypanosoma theileri]ORC88693.1 DNA mismatch repair protein MSH2 [Trypanosoma theileri]
MNGVEHVKIGKHIFPLYSHPLLRTRLREEAYVQQQIEEQLRDPRLQQAVNEVVEELFQQDITSELSEEETALLMERALARLDRLYQEKEQKRSPSPLSPLRQGLTSSNSNHSTLCDGYYNHSMDRRNNYYYYYKNNNNNNNNNNSNYTPKSNTVRVLQKIKLPTRQFSPLKENPNRFSSQSTRSVPLPTLRKGQKQHEMSSLRKRKESPLREKVKTNNDIGILYGPLAVPWRRFLPSNLDEEEEEDKKEQTTTTSQGEEEEEEKEKEEQSHESSVSPSPAVQAPPEWRNAVRTIFYSMLSLRLEGGDGVQFEEMDLRSGAQRLLKLQGAELDSLSHDAFGALDITMDGNSSAIHYRPKVEPSILQCSRMRQAEKAMKLKPNTLRQETISALARSNAISANTTERYPRITGASLKHSWLNNSTPVMTPTPVQGNVSFELPTATYRSRVLGSVVKKKPPC